MVECKKIEEDKAIDTDKPWSDDVLNRETVAKDFIALFQGLGASPFVISIDAPYGMGKTFFVKRLVESLKNDGALACYYNAWNTDFQSDPLIPFVNSILTQLPKDVKTKVEDYFLGVVGSFKRAINVAVGRENFVENVAGAVQDSMNAVAGVGAQCMDDYNKQRKVINLFKEKMSDEAKDRKIYIFVDELERCRPTYAVELLEIIKHLFDIPNVVFILSTDREQLKHTISKLYGANMDGDGYLRRFIDLELHLPSPNRQMFCNYLQTQLNIRNNELSESNVESWSYFKDHFVFWATVYELSLRDMVRYWTEVSYLAGILNENTLKFMPVLAWLLIVKSKDKGLFYAFKNNDYRALQTSIVKLQTKINGIQQNLHKCGNRYEHDRFFIQLKICTTRPEVLNNLSEAPDSDDARVKQYWCALNSTYNLYQNDELSGHMCELLSYISPDPIK